MQRSPSALATSPPLRISPSLPHLSLFLPPPLPSPPHPTLLVRPLVGVMMNDPPQTASARDSPILALGGCVDSFEAKAAVSSAPQPRPQPSQLLHQLHSNGLCGSCFRIFALKSLPCPQFLLSSPSYRFWKRGRVFIISFEREGQGHTQLRVVDQGAEARDIAESRRC
jgi:hypothetical protein